MLWSMDLVPLSFCFSCVQILNWSASSQQHPPLEMVIVYFMVSNHSLFPNECWVLIFSALSDGIENNEAFRHTRNEKRQESWTNLLQDLKFSEDMDEDEHIKYLKNRFTIGASEWLAGSQSHLWDTLIGNGIGFGQQWWRMELGLYHLSKIMMEIS